MQTLPIEQENPEIYTVSRLNSTVRLLLESSYPHIWVEGEISNFAAPHSGHWYFSLKDANAQIRCALFKGNQRQLGFIPKDGMHVLVKGRISLYENRGDFQLIAEDMEERGEGKLRRAFEILKKKLGNEGLFDSIHKKALPKFPKQIGILTSATGAAVCDILHVLQRRYRPANIIIYPTLVQGQLAAPNIKEAIELANTRNECDVLILARGGGSLEDLWPFNEEIVARAIFASIIPIISGVGHEIDFTIADFVADVRAPTPSVAAELATPDKAELLTSLSRNEQHLSIMMRNVLNRLKEKVSWHETHLHQQHPKRQLSEKMQRLDYLEASLTQLHLRLVHQLKTDFLRLSAKLDALSPLATLMRGYAIAMTQNHQNIVDSEMVDTGDVITVRLMRGMLECDVLRKIKYEK